MPERENWWEGRTALLLDFVCAMFQAYLKLHTNTNSFLSPPPFIIFTPTHLKRQMTLFGDKLYLQVAIYKVMNLSTAFSTVKDHNK